MSMIRITIQPEMLMGLCSAYLDFFEKKTGLAGDTDLDLAQARYEGATLGLNPVLHMLAPDVKFRVDWGKKLHPFAEQVSQLKQEHGIQVIHFAGLLADHINGRQNLADINRKFS